MRIVRIVTAILILFAFVGSVAPSVSAASADACFCYVPAGATKTDGAADGESCQKACAELDGYAGYLWATDFAQYPASNLRCYAAKDQCEKDMDGDKKIDGTWGVEVPSPECLPGSHYCFSADTVKTLLQVSIPSPTGNVTTVINFGEYVGAVYNYLLGFALILAIVFMMVGGIRYVVGASSGEIGKAKEMIVKAVSGFVLLLFAYLILFTVNPQLIKLQVPKLPMLKGVAFTQGDDCATMLGGSPDDTPEQITGFLTVDADAGEFGEDAHASDVKNATTGAAIGTVLKYDDPTPKCGTVAEVLRDANGGTIEGRTCNFSYCSVAGESCLVMPGKTPECMACKEVGPRNALGVVPNDAVCSGLDQPDPYVDNDPSKGYDSYNYCGYTNDPWLFVSGLGLSTTAALIALTGGTTATLIGVGYTMAVTNDAIYGSCAVMNIDCKQITTCEGYNGVEVASSIDNAPLSSLSWNSFGDPNIVDVCNQDPCGAGAKMTVPPLTAVTCAYNEGTGNCQTSDYEAPRGRDDSVNYEVGL